MKYIVIIIIAALFACNQKGKKKLGVTSGESLVIQPAGGQDTMKKNPGLSAKDSSVYLAYIPPDLRTYLAQNHPDWAIPLPGLWKDTWWVQYKKDRSLVNYVSGDFNCDAKPDHALILNNKKGNVAAWAFLVKNDGFEKVKLDEFENISSGPIGIGIEILEPGEYADLNNDRKNSHRVKCEGVTVIYFEKAARSYYWENGKLVGIQTRD